MIVVSPYRLSCEYRIKSTLHSGIRRYHHLLLLHFDYLYLSAFLQLLLRNQISLQLLDRVIIQLHPYLHCGPLDRPGRQVQLADQALRAHVDPVRLREDYRLGDLFPVGLVPAPVLDLNVQVQGALGTVELLTFLIRALETSLDVVRTASMVLLATRAITLRLESIQVLIVKALDFEGLGEQVVPIICELVKLGEKGLVLKVNVPVLVHVV